MRLFRYIAPALLAFLASGDAEAQQASLTERAVEAKAENGSTAKLKISGYTSLPIGTQARYSTEIQGRGIERAVFVVGVNKFEGSISQSKASANVYEVVPIGERERQFAWIRPEQASRILDESTIADFPSWVTDPGYEKTICFIEKPLDQDVRALVARVPVDVYRDGGIKVYSGVTINGRKLNLSEDLPVDVRETLPRLVNSKRLESAEGFGWVKQQPYTESFILLSGSSFDLFYQSMGDKDVLSTDPVRMLSVSGTRVLAEKEGKLCTADLDFTRGRPVTVNWTQIVDRGSISKVFLSPPGDSILYLRDGILYRMPIGGSETLASYLHIDTDENWVPWSGGESLVFPAQGDLWEADNRGTRRLTETSEIESGPQASPRNRNLSFILNSQIWIRQTGGQRQLTQGQGEIKYSWAPRDDFLAYSRGGRIFVVKTDTGEASDVTPSAHDFFEGPIFSPDERQILCRGRNGLYVIGLSRQ